MLPEERSFQASRAAIIRWAKQKGWSAYPKNGSDITRIEWHLRKLALIAAKAWGDDNHDRAIRCIGTMLGYERLKMFVQTQAGKPTGTVLDAQSTDITRLLEARERRAKAFREEADGKEQS